MVSISVLPSSSRRSASMSPAPQCHVVFEFITAMSTSLSSCFASEVPASAFSIRIPATLRLKNCSALSPGRRVSMPLTAFWR